MSARTRIAASGRSESLSACADYRRRCFLEALASSLPPTPRGHLPLSRPCLGEDEKKAVLDVMDSGMLAQGERVAEFERRFASFCGTAHAVALSSGTAALHSALHALGIGPGDLVITTPFTFVATANAVLMQGAIPIFVDIEPETYNMDVEALASALHRGVKAVIAVHLYGNPCHMEDILRLAHESGAVVVEDACQAHGASLGGRMAGSLGDAGCFSFYPTKNMTTGEGGMLITNDEETARRAARFRFHGQERGDRYAYRDLGYNYRLTELSAALGLSQLERLNAFNLQRRRNAELYTSLLQGIPGITTPAVSAGGVHVFNQYTLRVRKEAFGLTRDELAWVLRRTGIESGVYYPRPLHLYPHFSRLGHTAGDFPHAENAAREVLSIPVAPHVCEEDVRHVCACIKEVASRATP